MDNNYSGAVENPYSWNAGFNPIQLGVIAWSIGKDLDGAKTAMGDGDKKTGTYRRRDLMAVASPLCF